MLLFGGLALGVLVVAITLIICVNAVRTAGIKKSNRKEIFVYQSTDHIERFYEMIFSGTSILSFLSVYYLIERFVTTGEFREYWDGHKDMLLLVMICISCLLNTFLDRIVIPLKNISREEKAGIRMIGMLYIILIFAYIKFIYGNDNYDGFIMYFMGLMIGRFIYFDASFKDFVTSVINASKNTALLVLGLTYTGIMCYVGFTTDYLMISNGVLVSTFIAHIYMVISIFIIDKLRITRLVLGKVKDGGNNYYEDEYDEYDMDEDGDDDQYFEDYQEYDNEE